MFDFLSIFPREFVLALSMLGAGFLFAKWHYGKHLKELNESVQNIEERIGEAVTEALELVNQEKNLKMAINIEKITELKDKANRIMDMNKELFEKDRHISLQKKRQLKRRSL